MRSFLAFLKKELLECKRGAKFIIATAVFLAIGIISPLIVKVTPLLLDALSTEMSASGIEIPEMRVDALTSWAEYYSGIQMGLIAFAIMFANTFTKEYGSESLIIICTKGLARYKVYLAKLITMLSAYTVGYWISFVATLLINGIFWDNGVVKHLLLSGICMWLFGIFTVFLIAFYSSFAGNMGMVLLYTGGTVLVFYVLGMFKVLSDKVPTHLMTTTPLLVGAEEPSSYLLSIAITLALAFGSVFLGIRLLNKKQL